MSKADHGVYEQIIDLMLRRKLDREVGDAIRILVRTLDVSDSHLRLARHLEKVLRTALRQAGRADDKIEAQLAITNELIRTLAHHPNLEHLSENLVDSPGEELLEVWPTEQPSRQRPTTPLSDSSLFTGSRSDPSLASELRREIASADEIDILVSFVKWSGLRLITDELQTFTARKNTKLRVITTSYIGATEAKAVQFLASLPNTEVRISFETQITRLHAKAYLFQRQTGFHTAYVGSSNLSNPAMTEGLEWNIKISAQESPHILEKIRATFDTYWADRAFQPYDPREDSDHIRLKTALAQARGEEKDSDPTFTFFDLKPFDYQEEILEKLQVSRQVRDRRRNLVVAATGTGKTVVAAFDYRRFCEQFLEESASGSCRILFVAHREEILRQSLNTFRVVLRDANFGSLLVGGVEPNSTEHLFVSVQSLNSRGLLDSIDPDFYDYIVIDEFHHAAAASYQKLLNLCRPVVLLGLTATPERADGFSVLDYFGGEIDAEIRLPEAVHRRLLAPFQYFGISDTLDLSGISWKRGGYDAQELDSVVTGNDIRAGLTLDAVHRYIADPDKMRAICFCVSQAHAAYMAEFFSRHGLAAESLDANSPREDRHTIQRRLVRRDVNVICVVDLFNEGVDIPEVDTVLFLRPTESLTVFLQQLGRGLRLSYDKECLTVLDFIGQAHRNFRFADRFRALLGRSQRPVREEIEAGFPHLPAGCGIRLERMAEEYVLENIRSSTLRGRKDLVGAITRWTSETTKPLSLPNFLNFHGLDLDDIYRRGVTWNRLLVQANVRYDFTDPDETLLTKGLHRVIHANGRKFLETAMRLLSDQSLSASDLNDEDRLHLIMLHYDLWRTEGPALGMKSLDDSLDRLRKNGVLASELNDLLNILLKRVDHLDKQTNLPYPCPLELHTRYTREEILAGLGVTTFEKQKTHREGVLHIPGLKTDLLFVTLVKSEKKYSPTTMYEDYALSQSIFHWQSQSTTSVESPTGQRYINHRKIGHTILLFVREHSKTSSGLGAPFQFLGPVKYLRHEGSRPISFHWELETPMPAQLWMTSGKLAVGA